MSSDKAHELQVGQVFEGKYKILRELGRGGFGMVYLAFQEGMDRHVALKVLRSSVTAQAPSAKERFLREVKIISKLKHPNTVTIHDFGETYDGGLYMVLEYVEGETLKQVLKREGAQDALRASDLARQIARSLAEAHRHGVVHRDLKPANVMITSLDSDRDFVKVLDFGVARLLDSPTDDLTSVGLPEGERELIGTPRYMSPEQVRGESLTGASDIYGLGLIFYEMLSGSPAVQGDTTMGLITQQISPEPLNLPMSHSLEPVIQDIVRIGTAKSVGDRFQTAEQMADALEQAVFQIRRDRNLSGSGMREGGVPMSGYHSQLQQMQPGFNPGQGSGWNSHSGITPHGFNNASGFNQSGFQQQGNNVSGFNAQGAQPSGYNEYKSGLTPGPGFDLNQFDGPEPQRNFDFGDDGGQWEGGSGRQPSGRSPFATAGGMLGVSGPSGLNPAPVPADDFGQTVERDALDPQQLIQRPQNLFERNQHPSMELPAVEDGLPPLPADRKPFESSLGPAPPAPIEAPQEQKKKKKFWQREKKIKPADVSLPSRSQTARRANSAAPPEESLGQFALSVVKGCAFFVLSVVSTYFAFLVVGAALETLTGGMARVMGAFAVALAIPAVAFGSEFAGNTRYRLPQPFAERVAKSLMHTGVFALAVVIVTSGACAGTVVHELQDEPNWFLKEPDGKGFPSLNKRVSYGLSDFIGDVGHTVGLYDPKAAALENAPARTPALPASTRQGNQQLKNTAPKDDAKDLRDSKKPTGTYEEW